MSNVISPDQLDHFVGKEVGTSGWFEVDQDRINQFADATDDHQYIHVDPKRAAQTPFGTTIAHGFLNLSLLAPLSAREGKIKLENAVMNINYGLDKVRFINPVKVGKRIRTHMKLLNYEEKKPKHFLLKYNAVIEIEHEDKPALIAEWLVMTVVT